MEEIIVTISPSGKTTIEANGFTGQSCDQATQNIELVLSGGKNTDKSHKPEYHMPEVANQEIKRTF